MTRSAVCCSVLQCVAVCIGGIYYIVISCSEFDAGRTKHTWQDVSVSEGGEIEPLLAAQDNQLFGASDMTQQYVDVYVYLLRSLGLNLPWFSAFSLSLSSVRALCLYLSHALSLVLARAPTRSRFLALTAISLARARTFLALSRVHTNTFSILSSRALAFSRARQRALSLLSL